VKIAQLAPLSESVPPKGYGGTELVVSQLTEELIRRGHDVVLFATADSQTAAELVSVVPRGLRSDNVPSHRFAAYEMRSLLRLIERKHEFDIVHNHMGFLAFPFFSQLTCPVVSTIHNPMLDYCADIYRAYSDYPLVSISDAYKRMNLANEVNYVGRVYNAVDADGFYPGESSVDKIGDQDRKYLLFLGRVCHAKGTADAIKIARAVGLPLKIAGKVDRTDVEYFRDVIEPELHSDVEYIGEVGFEAKRKLYQDAIAVIYPIHFEEPFGLVMVEALASGTPLVALARGSVREILTDRTAVIGTSVEELIANFEKVKELKSSDCIKRAKDFSVAKMASGYEEVYTQVIERSMALSRR
jgi:glycosyltransferase involved in cell wall biosynthesis